MATATWRWVGRRWALGALVLVACSAILVASVVSPAQQQAATQPGFVAKSATSASSGATGRQPPSPASVHDGLSATTDGSYQTAVAFATPQYFGIAPHLSLGYSSGAGSGNAGHGWSLIGTPAIQRLGPGDSTPTYTSADQFYYSGQRLIQCPADSSAGACRPSSYSDVPGDPSQCVTTSPCVVRKTTTYFVTAVNNDERIARVDVDVIDIPNPTRGRTKLTRPAPSYWLVWTPSGTRSRFSMICQGCTSRGSQISRGDPIWRLDTVTDAEGHAVKYSYITPDGDGPGLVPTVLGAYLSQVQYRATTVKLYWEHRPDVVTLGSGHEPGFMSGLDAMRDRLKSVEVDTDGHLVRAYALSYHVSPTSQQSLLSSVQEYGDTASVAPDGTVTGADSQPPTKFCYQSDESLSTCGRIARQPAAVSDVDLGARPDSDRASGSELEADVNVTSTVSTWATGDFNGDGRSDFVALGATTAGLSYQVDFSGSGGSGGERVIPWSQSNPSNPYLGNPYFGSSSVYIRRAWPIDLAGHGIQSLLVDLVIVSPARAEAPPSDHFVLLTAADPQSVGSGNARLGPGDEPHRVDADRADSQATDSSPFQFQYSYIDVHHLDTTTYKEQIAPYCTVADFNGDGIDDFACVRKKDVGGKDATVASVWYSVQGVALTREANYDGFSPDGPAGPWSPGSLQPVKSADGWSFLAAAGDFYNDGRHELAVLNPDPIPPQGDYDQLRPYVFGLNAKGELQLTTYAQTGWTFAVGGDRTLGGLLAGDFNGDGRADLAVLVRNSDNSMRLCADNDVSVPDPRGYCVQLQSTYPLNSTITAVAGNTSGNGRSDIIMTTAGPQLPNNIHTAVDVSVSRPDTQGIFHADQIGNGPDYKMPYDYQTLGWLDEGPPETTYYSGASPDTTGSGLADFLIVLTTPTLTGTAFHTQDVPQIDQPRPTSLPDVAGQSGFTAGYEGSDRHLSEIYVNGGAPLDSSVPGRETGGHENTVIDSFNPSTGARNEQWFGDVALPIRAGWRFLDANGDGRTDLVYLSCSGTLLTIDTFASGTGSGWTRQPEQTITLPEAVPISQWQTVQLGAPPDRHQPQGNLSGLVAAISDNAGATSIDTLSYTGSGWTLATTAPLPAGTAPTRWMVADVNGDGRSDLVGIIAADPATTTDSVTVATILADGFAHWSGHADVAPATLPIGSSEQASDRGAWRVADLNGDGRSDLVFLDTDAANPDANAGFGAAAVLSNGDGTWTVPNPAPPTPGSDHPLSRWADQTWQAANSVQAGVTSLVHIVPSGPGFAVDDLSLSPDLTAWRISSIKNVQLPQDVGVSPWPWGTIDVDETGLASFTEFYIGADGHLHDMLVAPNIPADLIATVTSPFGETATMSFSPSRASSDADATPSGPNDACYLPEGAGEPVLTAESLAVPLPQGDQFNLYSPGGSSTTRASFTYTCPQYSTLAPGLLGFAYVGAHIAPTSAAPGIAERSTIDHYEIGPDADRRLLTHLAVPGNVTTPPAGMPNVIAHVMGGTPPPTKTQYQVGTVTYSDRAGPAGTISDVAQTMSRSCDNAAVACPTRNATYDYDSFGNLRTVASSLATDDSTPRQVVTTTLGYVAPNQDNYLVDLVATTTVTDSSQDTAPRQARFCYDNTALCDAATSGLLTTASRWDDSQKKWVNEKYSYTIAGALASITDPNGHTLTYQHTDGSDPQLPTAMCSAEFPNECAHTAWDDVLELPATTTDSNLQTTTRSYDPYGRVCEIDLPNGGATAYAYQPLATGTRVESVNATRGPGNPQARRGSIDLHGDVPLGCGSTLSDVQDRSTATYDAAGRLTVLEQQTPEGISSQYFDYFDATSATPGATTEPAFPKDCPQQSGPNSTQQTDSCGHYTAVTYDYLGRPISETQPSGNQATWSYSDGVVQHTPVSISTAEDGSFHDASAIDAWGQLLQETATGGQSSPVSTTTYTYDGLGRLATSTDEIGVAQTYSYDSLDRLTAESDPDRGRTTFSYDDTGNLTSKTTADGTETNYTYDGLNRLASTSHPGGTPVTLTYGETPSAANTVGRLSTIQDPGNSAVNCPAGTSDTYTYDAVGNPTQWTKCILGQTETFTTNYNPVGAGKLAAITYPDGHDLQYNYTADGSQTALTDTVDGAPSQPVVTDVCYNPQGALTHAQLGAPPNALNLTDKYNAWGAVDRHTITADNSSDNASCSAPPNSTALLDQTYSYSPQPGSADLGLLTGIQTTTQGQTAPHTTENVTLGRDGSGHLDGWTQQTTTATHTETSNIQYAYRSDGSLGQMTGAGTFGYPAAGPTGCGFLFWRHPCPGPPDGVAYTKGMSYQYDHAGQMTTLGTHTLTWNADGHLAWVQQSGGLWTHYVYDPSGKLVYSGTSTTGPSGHDATHTGTRIYGSLATTTGSNTPDALTRYYYFDGQLVSTSDQAGDQLVIPDQNGSPQALYGPHSATQQRFTPYGAPIGTSPPPPIAGEGYLGSWAHDPATGIVLLGARWYDPAIGQFLSPDPLYAATAPPGAGTAYSYGNDDPATYIDPSGLSATCDNNCDQGGGGQDANGDPNAQGDQEHTPGSKLDFEDPAVIEHVPEDTDVQGLVTFGDPNSPVEVNPDTGGDVYGPVAFDAGGGGGGGNMVAFIQGAVKGFAMGVATTTAIGFAVGLSPIAGTLAMAGIAAYGAYSLYNGGFASLSNTAQRIWAGQGTLSDWSTLGELVGGVASGGVAQSTTALGRSAGLAARTAIDSEIAARALASTRLARVVPAQYANSPTLAAAGESRAFVTAAADIRGISTSESLAERLSLLDEQGRLTKGPFSVTEFDPPTEGIGTPVSRDNPGFMQGGYTRGGAREFDIPNLKRSDLTNPFTYEVP